MSEDTAPSTGLRRELRFWEAIALSIAIMAPTAAMALNGVAIAGLIGPAVPLAFVFALIGVLLVSYAFVMLTREVNHAGSVYAFTGLTLGPRAGFLAGWALLGTYLCFTVASTAEVGLFFSSFLASTGITDSADWIWIALVAAAIIGVVAYGDVRVAARALLSLEGISIVLIVVLVVVIVVRLVGGNNPTGTRRRSPTPSRFRRARRWTRSPRPRCSASSRSPASRARRRSARRPTSPAATSRARSSSRRSASGSST